MKQGNIKNRSVKKTMSVVLGVIIVLITSLVTCGLLFAVSFLGVFGEIQVRDPDIRGALSKPTGDSANILLIGADKGGLLTDTIMLINFNNEKNEINMVSIMRDTRVMVKGRPARINSCAARGGTSLLIETVSELTGADINYYMKVNTAGFKKIVDLLDGVEFDVPQDMKYTDEAQDLYIDLKAGPQRLNGDKAEQLVRYRGYGAADVQRTKVQQEFMKAFIMQKLNPKYITKINDLFKIISENVETNITIETLFRYIGYADKITEDSIVTHAMEGRGQRINGADYFIHDYDKCYDLFKEFFMGDGAPTTHTYIIPKSQNVVQTQSTSQTQSDQPEQEDLTDIPSD